MCLSTGAALLGPADVVLDLPRRRLLFAPGLTGAQRVMLARRVLAAAGQEQPADPSPEVICICGFELDVSLAALDPGRREVRAAVDRTLRELDGARWDRLALLPLHHWHLSASVATGSAMALILLLLPHGMMPSTLAAPGPPPATASTGAPHPRRTRPHPPRLAPRRHDAVAAAPLYAERETAISSPDPGQAQGQAEGHEGQHGQAEGHEEKLTVPGRAASARRHSGASAAPARPCAPSAPRRCNSASR